MPVYRYTYVLANFRKRDFPENDYIFKAENDKKAERKVQAFIGKKTKIFGLKLIKGKLEKGRLVTEKIKVFKPKEDVWLGGNQDLYGIRIGPRFQLKARKT